MLARLKSVLGLVFVGGALFAVSGCCGSENKAATSKCAASGKNSDSCKACCKSVTSKDSYSYSSGSGCKCY